MISHPVYVRHSVCYIYDMIHTMYDNATLCVYYTTLGIPMTSFALQKTSHPLYHTKPQSLWLHVHFGHDITPPVSDVAPTVSLSSQPLHWYHIHFWMTSNPPSVWHHMHYILHHIQSLCHHTTILMTSQPLYMKPHPVCRATYTLYMRHHSHYLCALMHSIDNSTPTRCMTSHSSYVCLVSFPLYKTSHPHFMTWNHRVYVITPTTLDIV